MMRMTVDKTEAYRTTEAIRKKEFTADLASEMIRNVAKLEEFKKWLSGNGFWRKFTPPTI